MRPLTVAWISDFPIEWLADIPESLRHLPREHPATWEMVLLAEFEKNPALRVHVVVLRKNIQRSFSFQRNGVTFHLLKYPGGSRAPSLFWFDTLLIRRCLRKIKPDIIHAWGSERGAALVASRLPYPNLVTVQGLLSWYGEVLPASRTQKYYAWIEKISLSRARDATTESRFAVGYLQKKFQQLSVHQIEHASDWRFHQVERRPLTNPIRFLTNGTLSHRKGTDLLLLALNELASELRFDAVVIGAPNEAFVAPILAKLSPLARERITFKSDLPPASVAKELEQATIFLLPTRADTSPNAVKEAVVAGVPVVASEVGGIPDYVLPGQNGYLFPPGDLAAFTNAIRKACQHAQFGRGQLSPESLGKSRAYLSPARMHDRFLETYRAILGLGNA